MIRELIEQFHADESLTKRMNALVCSPIRREKLRHLYAGYLDQLPSSTDPASQADLLLFRNRLRQKLAEPEIPVPTFAETIFGFESARAKGEPIDSQSTAQKLADLAKSIAESVPIRENVIRDLRTGLDRCYTFCAGYDPLFTWWTESPYREVEAAFDQLSTRSQNSVEIPGHPVERAALEADLAFELIPYSPEKLIELAEAEYAWCEGEMIKASRDLGYGTDWRKALDHVKNTYVAPGEQPRLVRDLAIEAVEFIESQDLITLPELLKDNWNMEMMSPIDQKVNPFFLGGETIVVSFPTNSMSHDEKMMSLRGNNPYFARATVQHELIPGHQLQAFMEARYKPYRQVFRTPFWVEGWALYWEMRLWDLGFAKTPEERIGMLFWRMHRCVRVTFSLRFHLGQLTTTDCVEMLVDRVGHERLNAEGEVRRSFNGVYEPLYQAAYLIGGFQFMALYRELVGSGRFAEKEFHDAILHENNIPVSVLRSILLGEPSIEPWQFAA